MRPFFHAFLSALAFLTRLPVARSLEFSPAAALRAFPLVGLCLGLLAVAPLVRLFASHPLVQGWVYALILLWLTRGLHWDGLADLGDAWGSGAQGDRFWDILKDSRLGAFGALALLFGLFGYVLLAGTLFQEGRLAPLVWAPFAGRCTTAPLLWFTPTHPGSTLARLMAQGASRRLALFHALLGLGIATFTLGMAHGLAFAALAALGGWRLRGLALHQGGLNGDMLGTAILGGELLFLGAALI